MSMFYIQNDIKYYKEIAMSHQWLIIGQQHFWQIHCPQTSALKLLCDSIQRNALTHNGNKLCISIMKIAVSTPVSVVTRNYRPRGGGVHPYLGMVGRFRGDDPRFGDFQSDMVPITQHIPIDPFFLQKKSACLYLIQFQRYQDLKLV